MEMRGDVCHAKVFNAKPKTTFIGNIKGSLKDRIKFQKKDRIKYFTVV